MSKLTAKFFSYIYGLNISHVGRCCKLFISNNQYSGSFNNLRIGDYCWIETVHSYGEQFFSPCLRIEDNVSLSDNVHISCVFSITISAGTLIGSKVYIGDHSHGDYKGVSNLENYCRGTTPACRNLGDIGEISIGNNCWIGDNAVILRNTKLPAGCIIAANSVVLDLIVERPAIVGGIPAKIIKYLE